MPSLSYGLITGKGDVIFNFLYEPSTLFPSLSYISSLGVSFDIIFLYVPSNWFPSLSYNITSGVSSVFGSYFPDNLFPSLS